MSIFKALGKIAVGAVAGAMGIHGRGSIGSFDDSTPQVSDADFSQYLQDRGLNTTFNSNSVAGDFNKSSQSIGQLQASVQPIGTKLSPVLINKTSLEQLNTNFKAIGIEFVKVQKNFVAINRAITVLRGSTAASLHSITKQTDAKFEHFGNTFSTLESRIRLLETKDEGKNQYESSNPARPRTGLQPPPAMAGPMPEVTPVVSNTSSLLSSPVLHAGVGAGVATVGAKQVAKTSTFALIKRLAGKIGWRKAAWIIGKHTAQAGLKAGAGMASSATGIGAGLGVVLLAMSASQVYALAEDLREAAGEPDEDAPSRDLDSEMAQERTKKKVHQPRGSPIATMSDSATPNLVIPKSFAEPQEKANDIRAQIASFFSRARVEEEKGQFMKFGELPGGFEFLPDHRGRLGTGAAVAAAGAMPIRGMGGMSGDYGIPGGSFGGGGASGGYGGGYGGDVGGAGRDSGPIDITYSGGLKDIRSEMFGVESKEMLPRLAALGKVEVGGMSREAKVAWLETVFNRATVRKVPLRNLMSGKNIAYWGGGLGNPNTLSEEDLKEWQGVVDEVMGGSNVTDLATDNASNQPGNRLADKRLREGRKGKWVDDELMYVDQPYEKGVAKLREHLATVDPNAPLKSPMERAAEERGLTKNLPPPTMSDKTHVSAVTGKMWHEGHGVTSQFGYGRGRLHAGADIYATDPKTGKLKVGDDAPVNAPADGTIISISRTGNSGRAGNIVTFKDKHGYEHRFLHTSGQPAINPETGKPWKIGDEIKQGQQVTNITGSGTDFNRGAARMGLGLNEAVEYYDRTGWGQVNKPHLHHEVRRGGSLINPNTGKPYINELYPDAGEAGTGQRGFHPSKDVMMYSGQPESPPIPEYENKTDPTMVAGLKGFPGAMSGENIKPGGPVGIMGTAEEAAGRRALEKAQAAAVPPDAAPKKDEVERVQQTVSPSGGISGGERAKQRTDQAVGPKGGITGGEKKKDEPKEESKSSKGGDYKGGSSGSGGYSAGPRGGGKYDPESQQSEPGSGGYGCHARCLI